MEADVVRFAVCRRLILIFSVVTLGEGNPTQ